MITILLIFHVILALIIPDKVLANELFKDDFSNVDFTENNWEFSNIQNSDRLSWKIVNEKLVGQVSLRQGSLFFYNKNYDLENYSYSSYQDYIGILRPEGHALNKSVFPEYFEAENSFKDCRNFRSYRYFWSR